MLILTLVVALIALILAVYLYFFPPVDKRAELRARLSQAIAIDGEGRKLVLAKKYDQAIASFDSALVLSPSNSEILMDRAQANFKKGDFASALRDYQAVVDLPVPSDYHSDAMFGLALCQKALGQLTAATKTLHIVMAKDIHYIRAYQLQGDIYLADNNSEAAIDAYTQGLRRNPLSSVLHYDRAVAYLKREMNAQAFDDMTRSVQLDANNLPLLLKHANLARKLKKDDEADKDALEVVRLEPTNRSALAWLKHRGKLPADHAGIVK